MNESAPKVQEFQHNRLNRLLGKVGLVFGSGMAEFGFKHDGMGIPLHRRSTLQESIDEARNQLAIAEAAQSRSEAGEA